jgi:hypothetical protein
VAGSPKGWTFKSAIHQSRDLSETPFDLAADLDRVVITFTDRSFTLSGGVTGAAAGGVTVVLFPTDPARWIDYGRTSRRVASVTASSNGAFSLPAPPAGEYFLAVLPEDDADDWRDPAVLQKIAATADRIQVREGQNLTHALQVRRAP